MGVEFQESAFSVNSKNDRLIKSGMVFNVAVGFNNIEAEGQKDPKKKTYETRYFIVVNTLFYF